MTARRLRRRVALVVLGLVLVIALAVAFKIAGEDEAYTTVKELSPLVIAILAAYLASRFQARAAFHASLREVWSELIEAKNELVAYTMLPAAGPERYAETYKQLSKAIDEVRGVYRNVREDDRYRGYYPYQPLHEMREILEGLGPEPTAQAREDARERIREAWGALRRPFLAEFEPPQPMDPITDWDVRDDRIDDAVPEDEWMSWRRRLKRL